MDKLSIFTSGISEVTTENSLDNVVEGLISVLRELRLTRKGHEEWDWGDEVEDSEIDLEELDE